MTKKALPPTTAILLSSNVITAESLKLERIERELKQCVIAAQHLQVIIQENSDRYYRLGRNGVAHGMERKRQEAAGKKLHIDRKISRLRRECHELRQTVHEARMKASVKILGGDETTPLQLLKWAVGRINYCTKNCGLQLKPDEVELLSVAFQLVKHVAGPSDANKDATNSLDMLVDSVLSKMGQP